jgi:hypothetical protein
VQGHLPFSSKAPGHTSDLGALRFSRFGDDCASVDDVVGIEEEETAVMVISCGTGAALVREAKAKKNTLRLRRVRSRNVNR